MTLRSADRPYAFTEQGVAMLSSVLHSDRAVAVNIRFAYSGHSLVSGNSDRHARERHLVDDPTSTGSRIPRKGRSVEALKRRDY
jgi:hypothetical protein